MLVLSRKKSESIVFPALGISIQVLRSNSNGVKLGIVAPKNLQVLRGEIASCDVLLEAIGQIRESFSSHERRNQLNSLMLKLEWLRRAESRGLADDDLEMIQSAIDSMLNLDAEFAQLVQPLSGPNAGCPGLVRLLVVDDNANERELLSAVLTLQGFSVQLAEDGVEAIQALNDSPLPDAVLLDLQMPRLGGEETLRCIRTDDRLKEIKVIGISGAKPRRYVLPEGLPSFDAWFTKPLDLTRLVKLLGTPQSLAATP